MKKTLLAAALMAGFAGIAQAETSVTLYGILDGGIGYERFKTDRVGFDTKRTGLIQGVQSGNRWGLKGSEDLGNGLRAVFVLESGFDLGNGMSGQSYKDDEGNKSTRLFGRQATLGLAGDSWGQLDLGRQTNIASKYVGSIDPFSTGFGQAGMGSTFASADTLRYDNMVMYQTPNFSGFQFGVGYSFQSDGPQAAKVKGQKDTNTNAITTGLRYANGPVALALSYDQQRAYDAFDNKKHTQKNWNVAGAYDFEVVKLHAAFGQDYDGKFGDGYNKKHNYNNYMVGLSAPVGAGNVLASWQMDQPRKEAKRLGDEGGKKQHVYSLGYTHPLSKRTNVYAIGSYAKDLEGYKGDKGTLLGLGLRHQF